MSVKSRATSSPPWPHGPVSAKPATETKDRHSSHPLSPFLSYSLPPSPQASLTMDMEEVFEDVDEKLGQRRIKFRLVDSAMFSDFSGRHPAETHPSLLSFFLPSLSFLPLFFVVYLESGLGFGSA